MNFKATCPMRAAPALVTKPKAELRKLPFAPKNWAWLKALNNSPRNCRCFDSVSRRSLISAMSQLFKPGPWKNRRLAFPSCPRPSWENKVLLK